MCNNLSHDLITWVATGLSKGFITSPEEVSSPKVTKRKSGRRKVANGVYFNSRYKKYYIKDKDRTLALGPYGSERIAKMIYTRLLNKEQEKGEGE
jgi:hypothetical protein